MPIHEAMNKLIEWSDEIDADVVYDVLYNEMSNMFDESLLDVEIDLSHPFHRGIVLFLTNICTNSETIDKIDESAHLGFTSAIRALLAAYPLDRTLDAGFTSAREAWRAHQPYGDRFAVMFEGICAHVQTYW